MANLALLGCASRLSRDDTRLSLVSPRIDADLVIREVAGLRPFRPGGFRVEAERFDDRLLIHNYGHGGCGISLSWGTARLALDHALAQPRREAAVLGCGAVGLATARLLQDHGFIVTIYARELPPATTSNVAGAWWAPSGLLDREYRTPEFGVQLARASRYANRYFQLLPDQRYGVRWLSLYFLTGDAGFRLGWDWALTPELFRTEHLPPGAHPFGHRHAHVLQAMIIEPSIYLPALMDAFRLAGGRIFVRELRAREEVLRLPEPVIVNCTGLGARQLFGDESLVPIKGQLTVLVPQPAVDYAVVQGGLYLFPRRDGIQLGGTHERGEWSTAPDPRLAAELLADHRALFATMQG